MTFVDFYRALRERAPFPWMERLAQRFVADSMPDVIDLPTGSGKSDLVIVWAWARTKCPSLPRRLWMVSDRRVIVDQTYDVALALKRHDIRVSRLRGGIVADDDDLLDPVAQQVIVSTVDQLGSRLLFRAYGGSPRSWPIWAGLAGNDSLIVLDEAHLSPVAADTFAACRRLRADIRFISMTATPRLGDQDRFGLTAKDRDHPVLGRRLATKRIVELREKTSAAAVASELLTSGCRKLAIICNTVRSARETFAAVQHADKHLLIGRQRPLDRDRILADLVPRLRSGAAVSQPLVVVATQCIEAGADFDFDGMVSEACPIDALRQRLGRLDRLGQLGEARCILIKPDEIKDVPPYGRAPDETWRWLQKHAKKKPIDLGGHGWEALAALVPEAARSSRPEPVTLLQPHLRMLTWTSPRPSVEPDVDLLLHGRQRAPGSVFLVWREDVATDDVDAANEILAILPPDTLEACEVPLWEFRAWLSGRTLAADAGDVEGAQVPEPPREQGQSVERVLRWEGADMGAVGVRLGDVRPGEILVLPATSGGYDRFGWCPSSREPVVDLAAEAYEERTGRRVERYRGADAEVSGDRVLRWSGGVVVMHFSDQPRSRRGLTKEVELVPHAKAVAERARDYALALGLDADALFQAGLHHDDGKADPRWQLLVNGGDLQRLGGPPLAKGEYVRTPLARLPPRWRHEAESLRRLPPETAPLVRWLVATHHGYGRPFWPIAEHGTGLAELMDALAAEGGPWRLALHEAVLRCADRAVSKEEVANG